MKIDTITQKSPTVVGAYSISKSAPGLLHKVLTQLKDPALFLSDETPETVTLLLLANSLKVDLNYLKSGNLPADRWKDVVHSANDLVDTRLLIDAMPGSRERISQLINRSIQEHQIRSIICEQNHLSQDLYDECKLQELFLFVLSE